MLDSIYHMTNTLKSHFWRKNVIILSLCTQRCYGRHNVPLVVYRFYCMALFHSQTRRHMIKSIINDRRDVFVFRKKGSLIYAWNYYAQRDWSTRSLQVLFLSHDVLHREKSSCGDKGQNIHKRMCKFSEHILYDVQNNDKIETFPCQKRKSKVNMM